MFGDERFESLGDRMKSYESRNYLTSKVPVILRVDGKAFHSLTRGMERPFDSKLLECMRYATLELAKEISGCKLAYTQSDEASFLITDFGDHTEGWFKYNKSKIESVSASIFTLAFSSKFYELFADRDFVIRKPYFDARSFSLGVQEVPNYFIWRQWDAIRNSIQMVARSVFSHNQCNNKNGKDLQDMLLNEKGINWNTLAPDLKRGVAIYKQYKTEPNPYHEKYPHNTEPIVTRGYWYTDLDVVEFSKNKNFIESLLL